MSDVITVPIIPPSMRLQLLHHAHNEPSARHHGTDKTLNHLQEEAYWVGMACTTAYHPQGDGMVECFNRSLLQLLRSYVEKEADWEQHLPLVLFAYRIATHSLTGTSPFLVMFSRQPKVHNFNDVRSYDISS